MDKLKSIDLSHHKRYEYCTSRLRYRDGRRLTAVKVRKSAIVYAIKINTSHLNCSTQPTGIHNREWIKAFAGVWRTTDQLTPRGQTSVFEIWPCDWIEKSHRWIDYKWNWLVNVNYYCLCSAELKWINHNKFNDIISNFSWNRTVHRLLLHKVRKNTWSTIGQIKNRSKEFLWR